MIEIERKFKVRSEIFKTQAKRSFFIKQGFLNSDKNRVVRVRLSDGKGWLTIKGKSSKDGMERFEWEKEISENDAEELLNICELPLIEKRRFLVEHENHIFEVDEFYGDNEGLVIAELELSNKDEKVNLPPWIGEEVTGEVNYYNANLITNPYKYWNQ